MVYNKHFFLSQKKNLLKFPNTQLFRRSFCTMFKLQNYTANKDNIHPWIDRQIQIDRQTKVSVWFTIIHVKHNIRTRTDCEALKPLSKTWEIPKQNLSRKLQFSFEFSFKVHPMASHSNLCYIPRMQLKTIVLCEYSNFGFTFSLMLLL